MDKSSSEISSNKDGLADDGWFQAVQVEFHALMNKSIAVGCVSTQGRPWA